MLFDFTHYVSACVKSASRVASLLHESSDEMIREYIEE
jgi:hypothetical protein